MQSTDLIIRTERGVIEVVLGLEEEVKDLRREFEDFKQETRQEFKAVRQEMKEGFTELHNEIRIINERINSINNRLGSVQYLLEFGLSVGCLLLVALPLIWGVRKYFSERFRKDIKDIAAESAREAIKQELSQRG